MSKNIICKKEILNNCFMACRNMLMNFYPLWQVLCFMVIFLTTKSFSQWSKDPSNNLIVGYGLLPEICSDSTGGAYITYEKNIVYPRQLVLKRINQYGYMAWDTSRLIVGEWPNTGTATLVSDGSNGVIIAYKDGIEIRIVDSTGHRTFNYWRIRMQRVDSSGNLLWGEKGMRVSLAENNQGEGYISIVSDGAGGCFLAWKDTLEMIKAQWINNQGERVWSDTGIIIAENSQYSPLVEKTSATSFAVAYGSHLKGVNDNGNILWREQDIDAGFGILGLLGNGKGELIIGGIDFLEGVGTFAVAQKVDSSGNYIWSFPYIVLSDTGGISWFTYSSITNSDGGATFAWLKGGVKGYSQRIRGNGTLVFQNGGKKTSGYDSSENGTIKIISSFDDSKIYFNSDSRNGGSLFAQRMDSSGIFLWSNNDIGISYRHLGYVDAISDSRGGIIIIGFDQPDFSIRVQQCSRNGNLGETITGIIDNPSNTYPQTHILYQNYPNPFNPSTTIEYQLKNNSQVRLELLSTLGQSIKVLINEFQYRGNHRVVFIGKELPSGTYFYRLITEHETLTKPFTIIK
ncbi:MAG: T9SS type A sorting domain-containing protein [Ignavibacteriae bacterium]|nr:T9SS type A sorting domain-containing protein [Ignavibacteriota bacterium]